MDTYTYDGRRRAEKKTLEFEKGVWGINTSIPIDIFCNYDNEFFVHPRRFDLEFCCELEEQPFCG